MHARSVESSLSGGPPVRIMRYGSITLKSAVERRYGEVRRSLALRTSVSKKLLAYSRAVDLRIRRAGRPPRLPLQARGLPPHTLRRIARLFAQDLGEC